MDELSHKIENKMKITMVDGLKVGANSMVLMVGKDVMEWWLTALIGGKRIECDFIGFFVVIEAMGVSIPRAGVDEQPEQIR